MTRRRSPLGFRAVDERFVPASEICEVFREADAVRVDLRGDSSTGGFFQFWTGSPATAGTIVRLLPTTRTIEYEGAPEQAFAQRPPLTLNRRRRARHRIVWAALIVGFFAVAGLLMTDIALRRSHVDIAQSPIKLPIPTMDSALAAPTVPRATAAEVESARAEIQRFDERMDGLRAQYRTAFEALQSGNLSQDEFVDGIHKWLIPQWRALYSELSSRAHAEGSLTSLLRKRLMGAAIGWDHGLQDYAEGLQTHSYNAVVAAFDQMSDGNESRREAWRMLDRAEIELTSPLQSQRAR